jgi:hypothetical protein
VFFGKHLVAVDTVGMAKHKANTVVVPDSTAGLMADAANPRTISDEAAAGLGYSIGEFGDLSGITFNTRTGELVCGHQRLGQIRAKWGELPIEPLDVGHGRIVTPAGVFPVRFVDWAKAKQRAANIAANSTAIAGEFTDLLFGQLDQVQAETPDLYDELLFGAIDEMDDAAGDVAEDTPPEPPANPVTRAGDLWTVGNAGHRVLCGDSSDPRHVQDVAAGQLWDVVILDPPYDAPDATWARWIHDPSIVFGQAKHLRMIPEKLWRFERVIVKAYRHRSATVQLDHRHAFVAQVGSDKHLPHSADTFPSVIAQDNDTQHDHAKPVLLLVEHLTQWTPAWAVAFDPYLGSGSTIMAAEHLDRRCFGIEIDPAYCDVIVSRFLAKYPDQPVTRQDGKTWAECAGAGAGKVAAGRKRGSRADR